MRDWRSVDLWDRAVLCLLIPLILLASPSAAQKMLTWDQRDEAARLTQMVDAVADGGYAGGDAWLKWSHHLLRGEDGSVYIPFSVVVDEAPDAFQTASVYVRVAQHGENSRAGRERMRRRRLTGFGPGEVPINVPERDFVPRGTPVAAENAAMLRLAHPEGIDEATYPFEDVHFIDLGGTNDSAPYTIRRSLTVEPGDYDVYVAIREAALDGSARPDAKSALLKRRLHVPAFDLDRLQLSSVIVADAIEPLAAPLSATEQLGRPYALGGAEITPVRDTIFDSRDNLSLVFFMYNLLTDSRGRPNVSVRYTFYSLTMGRVEPFRSTAPQDFNIETLPDEFDLRAVGAQLPTSQGVPLQSFPEGTYTLQIQVIDHLADASLVEDVSFVVMDRSGAEP
ncbi:MAG: hypothetical protein QGF21_09795 [Vicinamibacterales bacterium]|jgi:hypothetical protein|nr:hypothetical protein [Acidobacteriota bacterium]MDP7471615.1 hypothetical protein [Vicinamibacterales bacterium]MDP7672221.1 hypothetical protein [Vicinamibacterales bacterium]HJO37642.1 hypothetical protein [Vicinamibacterales bacterium]|tara:strand:- start:1831 stop:3015 length:1185 start_codon:yes stop_codon:yes gene_type:complete